MDGLILGVDGGGSGCRLALRWRARGLDLRREAGPANPWLDRARALGNLRAGLAALAEAAGLSLADLAPARGHFGLAGILRGTDPDALARDLVPELGLDPARITVSDDQLTTLRGAFGADDGHLLGIGTGSYGAVQRGGVARFLGGHGRLLGDQASGYALGLRALRRTLLAADGLAPHTQLTREILAGFGQSTVAMVDFSRSARASDIAAFAPRVLAAADEGDDLGRALLCDGVAYLEAALVALGHDGGPLCLSGGLAAAYARRLPAPRRAAIRAPIGSALDGALWLAESGGA